MPVQRVQECHSDRVFSRTCCLVGAAPRLKHVWAEVLLAGGHQWFGAANVGVWKHIAQRSFMLVPCAGANPASRERCT